MITVNLAVTSLIRLIHCSACMCSVLNKLKIADRANYLNWVLYIEHSLMGSSLEILPRLRFKFLTAKFELGEKGEYKRIKLDQSYNIKLKLK